MSKHTEGPWIHRHRIIQDGTGGSREDSVVHYRNEAPHGETRDEYICRRVTSEADAKLIAAAPDLLEAAKKVMMRWADYIHFIDWRGESDKYVAQAREYGKMLKAAIAKAEGEG